MKLVFGATWFEKARPFIQKIVEGSAGCLSEDGIRGALDTGQYWLACAVENDDVRAALIANPIHFTTGVKVLEILGLTGEGMSDWIHLEPELRAAAKKMGFNRLKLVARPGWSRVLKNYTTTHVVLEVEI